MDYFEFIQQPSSYLWVFELGYCGMGCYRSRIIFSNSSRELNIEGLYFSIASIDVQHYNSWVAPHFTQPNGLTPRAHWGSRQGRFPSFFWSKFYKIQGLGLIESHSQELPSIAAFGRFYTKIFLIDDLILLMIQQESMFYHFYPCFYKFCSLSLLCRTKTW